MAYPRCKCCNNAIVLSPSLIINRQYCSRNCYSAHTRKGKPVKCELCGMEFYRSPAKVNNKKHGNFCSCKCANQFKITANKKQIIV